MSSTIASDSSITRNPCGTRFHLFAAGDWRKDRFSGYDKQVTEAVGYGRRLVDSERQMFSVEGGLGAKQSTLVDGTDLDEGILRD
jgi:putative salt-induced outer membrane protein